MDAQHFRSINAAIFMGLAIHLDEIYQSISGKY